MDEVGALPIPQGIFEESVTRRAPLGTRRKATGGRYFIYCKAGEAMTAGQLQIMTAMVANHIDIACVAGDGTSGSVGNRAITVTLGPTAATSNQYEDGFLHFTDVGPAGRTHMIKRNPAADASATLKIDLYDALLETVGATHKIGRAHV